MKILFISLMAVLPVMCLADVVVPIDSVSDSVNIRLSPDATTEVVGRLKQGESTLLIGSDGGWHEVALEGGATGYISADWTKVVRDDEQVVEPSQLSIKQAPVAESADVEAGAVEKVSAEGLVIATDAVDEAVESVEEVVEVDTEREEVTPEPVAPTEVVPAAGDGAENYLAKFRDESQISDSQIYDNGNQIGIGTTTPKQRLEVNGSIQIHDQNSGVAGLIITQSTGETGYIMHNRASTLTIGAGSQDRITIDSDGNVGIAVSRPSHPLQMASGAHVTVGGVWTNSSSREGKENIAALSGKQALSTVMELQPVIFNYRNESGEDYVGFVAEDVPNLVAMNERDSLSPMDIVAVLTRAVQEQQRQINELEARLDAR